MNLLYTFLIIFFLAVILNQHWKKAGKLLRTLEKEKTSEKSIYLLASVSIPLPFCYMFLASLAINWIYSG